MCGEDTEGSNICDLHLGCEDRQSAVLKALAVSASKNFRQLLLLLLDLDAFAFVEMVPNSNNKD